MKFLNENKWMIACAVLALALLVLLAVIFSGEKPTAEVKVHEIGTTQQREEDPTSPKMPALFLIDRVDEEEVMIRTSYCTLTFPLAFTDLVESVIVDNDDRIAIDFYARLNGGHYPLYSISFVGEGDIDLGTLQLIGRDEPCAVTALFYDISSELEGDDVTSFYAGQETFNDVWASLERNMGFTPAQ